MGLFSGKTVVQVSSVVYNMAGDEPGRPDFLKSLMAQHMMAPANLKLDLARTITNGYLQGPLLARRSLMRWTDLNQPDYLMSGSVQSIQRIPDLDLELASYITLIDPLAEIEIANYSIERANFFYWAENYVAETYPALIDSNWTCDLAGDNVTVTISGDITDTFVMSGFNVEAKYFFVRYSEVTYDIFDAEVSRYNYIWPYELGTDAYPALEDLLGTAVAVPEFFPVVPIRQDNISVSESVHYDDVAEIYRKLSGRKKLEELLASIEDPEVNPSIADIDHAAVVFGVCVNDRTRASKRYMYSFFKSLIPYQNTTTADFLLWREEVAEAVITDASMRDPAINSLEIAGQGAYNSNYRFVLNWAMIDESFHTGVGKLDAKPHDMWFEEGDPLVYTDRRGTGERAISITSTVKTVDLFWQIDETSYKKLRIYGMLFQNFVYGGKAATTELWAGINDADDSEFFLPLHRPTLELLGMVDATQLCTSSVLIVFNCYAVHKLKWYQTGFFKILLVLAGIVVSVLVNPAAMGAVSGLLGTNLAVGTALGLSGLGAIIAGAAANAIAGIILSTVIQSGATAIFGEKFGAIIGAIASFVVMNFGSAFGSGGPMNIAWDKLMLPENLLKLASVGANAVTGWVNGSIAEINSELLGLKDEYTKDSKDIADRYYDVLGYSGVTYDPLMFAQVADSTEPRSFSESSDAFLKRTLLVGSEIVEISHTMIADFPTLSLQLPRAFA